MIRLFMSSVRCVLSFTTKYSKTFILEKIFYKKFALWEASK